MKRTIRWFLTVFGGLAAGCGPAEVGSGPKPPPAAAEWVEADPADHEFTVQAVSGGLEVLEDGRVVSRVAAARPVVERTMFVKEGRQVIVRSRGAEGPALLELFDSRSGVRRAVIGENEVFHGRPAWAAGLATPLP